MLFHHVMTKDDPPTCGRLACHPCHPARPKKKTPRPVPWGCRFTTSKSVQSGSGRDDGPGFGAWGSEFGPGGRFDEPLGRGGGFELPVVGRGSGAVGVAGAVDRGNVEGWRGSGLVFPDDVEGWPVGTGGVVVPGGGVRGMPGAFGGLDPSDGAGTGCDGP